MITFFKSIDNFTSIARENNYKNAMKILTKNKKAYVDYEISADYVAGIVLA
jgi:tmRNA-binding protein